LRSVLRGGSTLICLIDRSDLSSIIGCLTGASK
jgi:hypothetical protein